MSLFGTLSFPLFFLSLLDFFLPLSLLASLLPSFPPFLTPSFPSSLLPCLPSSLDPSLLPPSLSPSMLCLKVLSRHVYFKLYSYMVPRHLAKHYSVSVRVFLHESRLLFLFNSSLLHFSSIFFFFLFGALFPGLAYLLSTVPIAFNLFCSSVFNDILINGPYLFKGLHGT